MWLTGLVAPWHVGSSQTRARTRVPCIGRQILNHCATREAPKAYLNKRYTGMLGDATETQHMYEFVLPLWNFALGFCKQVKFQIKIATLLLVKYSLLINK